MTSSVAIIHYPGATEKSRSVVASLVRDQLKLGHKVVVIDISRFTTISQDLPPKWAVALLGHRVDHGAFRAEIVRLGGDYVLAGLPRQLTKLKSDDADAIAPSVESELLTYFRTDRLEDFGGRARRLRQKLWMQVERTFQSLAELLATQHFDTILIPNGRTSRQKAARVLAESRGIEVLFYEHGRAQPDHYYLGTTQPHDRISSQAELPRLTSSLATKDISALAKKFLELRMGRGSETNRFSRHWTTTKNVETHSADSPQRAVFFSSSFDEYLAFGQMWLVDSWDHQFEDFDQIMTHLERNNTRLELRLHPNLVNKSRSYFRREIANVRWLQARHPQLKVHWHNSETNSYDLISQADMVFVERSTVGLEASMLGVPVWTTQASQWDEVADMRRLLSRGAVSDEALTPWQVETLGAERFAAYWMIQEHPLRYSWKNWTSWNPGATPLLIRISTLFTKNPWSHRWHLLRVEYEKYLNRKFSASKNVARSN